MTTVVLGALAAAMTTGAWIPQLLRTWRLRSARELSWLYLMSMSVGLLAWLLYGTLRDDAALVVANSLTLSFVGSLVLLKGTSPASTVAPMTAVEGVVAPGYESVRAVIEAVERPWGRGGGSYAAYVDGRLVVDLWGGQARPGRAWSADTLAGVASVTKGWASLVVGRLVEQGVLDYTTPLVEWWPEFGAHGKSTITLNEIFLHSSGVLGFDDQVALLDADDCAGWKDLDAIAAALADARPVWAPGSRHGYHAVSFGWILNEVVRRTTSRTIGEHFRTDFAEPLHLDSHLGTHGADLDRVAHVLAADSSALPLLQRRIMASISARSCDPYSLPGRAFLGDGSTTILDRVEDYMTKPAFLEAEIPASNGTTTARSLAKLYACLAAGGTLDGVTVLQPETLEELRETRRLVKDSVTSAALPPLLRRAMVKPTPATYGLPPNPRKKNKTVYGPNPRTFCSMGYGGQLVVADPDAGVSMASVCSDYTPGLDALQPAVFAALLACR